MKRGMNKTIKYELNQMMMRVDVTVQERMITVIIIVIVTIVMINVIGKCIELGTTAEYFNFECLQ